MLNYHINSLFFPTLKDIESRSVTFSSFYSSATSTLMVMSDLAYKGSYVDETLRTIDWQRRNEVKKYL